MSIRALMPRLSPTGTSIVQLFDAPPHRAVTWSVESGPGSVTGFSLTTDAQGTAWALYDPEGDDGAVVVRATYGA